MDDATARLRDVPLFRDLSDRELQVVSSIGKLVEFDPGHTITRQDDLGAGFHLILDGEVAVDINGRRRATLGSGDYFGEMSLLDGRPRSATVSVISPLRTFSLTSWQFLPLLDEHPSIVRKLLVELCGRLRAAERPRD